MNPIHAARVLRRALEARRASNATTARVHPDGASRHEAGVRADAYALAVDELDRAFGLFPLEDEPARPAAPAPSAEDEARLARAGSAMLRALDRPAAPYGTNGGVVCDVAEGACACGAWHQGWPR